MHSYTDIEVVLVPTAIPLPRSTRNGSYLKMLFLATLINDCKQSSGISKEKCLEKLEGLVLKIDSNRTRANKYLEVFFRSEFFDSETCVNISEKDYLLRKGSPSIISSYENFRDFIIACVLTNVRSCSTKSLSIVTGLSTRQCQRLRIRLVKDGLVRRKERFVFVEESTLSPKRIRKIMARRKGKNVIIECFQISPCFYKTTKLKKMLFSECGKVSSKTPRKKQAATRKDKRSNPGRTKIYRLRRLENSNGSVKLGKKEGYSTSAEIINLSNFSDLDPSGLSFSEIKEFSRDFDGDKSDLVMQKIINDVSEKVKLKKIKISH